MHFRLKLVTFNRKIANSISFYFEKALKMHIIEINDLEVDQVQLNKLFEHKLLILI